MSAPGVSGPDEAPMYIRKFRAMRMHGDCAPTIAFGIETNEGFLFLFSISDASAYDFIRCLTRVLFNAEDPPRSGAGSPGASLVHE